MEHTRLPSSVLRLAATAPASAGRASWHWTVPYSDCGGYPGVALSPDGTTSFEAVVLAAYDASGRALGIFAIAAPGGWDTSVVIC